MEPINQRTTKCGNALCNGAINGFNRDYEQMLIEIETRGDPEYWQSTAEPVAIPWKSTDIAMEAWHQLTSRGKYGILRHIVDLFFYVHKAGDYGKMVFNCPVHPLKMEILSQESIIFDGKQHMLFNVCENMVNINPDVFGTVDPWRC